MTSDSLSFHQTWQRHPYGPLHGNVIRAASYPQRIICQEVVIVYIKYGNVVLMVPYLQRLIYQEVVTLNFSCVSPSSEPRPVS
jgi:hypothetical protein